MAIETLDDLIKKLKKMRKKHGGETEVCIFEKQGDIEGYRAIIDVEEMGTGSTNPDDIFVILMMEEGE